MPAWSPDGNWIAYTSETNEEIHLRLLNVSTARRAH
jgi:Tol biopolymer transport system component